MFSRVWWTTLNDKMRFELISQERCCSLGVRLVVGSGGSNATLKYRGRL